METLRTKLKSMLLVAAGVVVLASAAPGSAAARTVPTPKVDLPGGVYTLPVQPPVTPLLIEL